jgi:hypothetical protein
MLVRELGIIVGVPAEGTYLIKNVNNDTTLP